MNSPLDPKTEELVAMAAAVTGNCPECFTRHFRQAMHLNVPVEQIEATIEVARMVRSLACQTTDTQILRCLATAPAFSDGCLDDYSPPGKEQAQ